MLRQMSLSLFLALSLMGATVPRDQNVVRPSSEWALKSTSPPSEQFQERGEMWWELVYQNGNRDIQKQLPGMRPGLTAVYWHVNDYRQIGGTLANGGKVIGLDFSKIETFTYPLFWSGKTWLTEEQLKRKAPQVYQLLYAKALKQHKALRRIQQAEELTLNLIQQEIAILAMTQAIQGTQYSDALKQSQEKRLKHLKQRLLHDQTLLKKMPPPQDRPASLVKAMNIHRELEKAQRKLASEVSLLEQVKHKGNNALQLKELSQRVEIMKETYARLLLLKTKIQTQGLDLFP